MQWRDLNPIKKWGVVFFLIHTFFLIIGLIDFFQMKEFSGILLLILDLPFSLLYLQVENLGLGVSYIYILVPIFSFVIIGLIWGLIGMGLGWIFEKLRKVGFFRFFIVEKKYVLKGLLIGVGLTILAMILVYLIPGGTCFFYGSTQCVKGVELSNALYAIILTLLIFLGAGFIVGWITGKVRSFLY